MTSHHYIHILDSMPIGVIVTDLSGNIQTINRHAKSVMNIIDDAIDQQHIATLLMDKDMVLPGNSIHGECFRETIAYKIERNGRILEMASAPLSGENDRVAGYVFTIKDITEMERNQELEKNREKHAAIGELSADIAHEIRNPLGSIELFASLLKKELTCKKDIERVNQIITAARNVEDKISNLILLSKTHQIPAACVNVHDILKDILLFSEQIIDQDTVFLSARYADIEPLIECNHGMMKQVFQNLILNALQEIPDGGRLDITTKYVPENHTIEIHFVDRDLFNPNYLNAGIYSRFFQTKGRYSGLGLALMHNIVNMYKGSMRMEYAADVGSVFVLSFPLVSVETLQIDSYGYPTGEKATIT